jgi:predicted GH43/DUF377 family glycosyl hydrolase
MKIAVNRKDIRFDPDPTRIITRSLITGGPERALTIIERVLDLTESEVTDILNQVLREFSKRHRSISTILKENFNYVREVLTEFNPDSKSDLGKKAQKIREALQDLNKNKSYQSKKIKLLIGSYFTMEYSIESAAFFNPSIVEDPDQSGLTEEGQLRVIVSFRATGEGHISSIVFRNGIIDKENNIRFFPPGQLEAIPEKIRRNTYKKPEFIKKLNEMDTDKNARGKDKEALLKIKKNIIKLIMDKLDDEFIYGNLQASIEEVLKNPDLTFSEKRIIESINWLADSHYEIEFSLDTSLSERVIFPISYAERNGIEDARFVKFTDDKGDFKYYATYTAYDGSAILPKFIETKDFYRFRILPINGAYAQNKGMALFPRKIKGKYVMASRYDGENNYIMFSDHINLWQSAEKIESPLSPWEFIQVGNSGSPIETEKGWLLLTHGVGPMRTYCIGAALLDLDNPVKVIGHLKEPLLVPNSKEREGYVPNVVYSCGSIIHQRELIIPYAMSDTSSTFATVSLDDLLDALLES